MQSWFYDSVGASAWGECGPVPFDITSNAFIANQYAQIALTMLPETSLARTPTRADRLIVVEMGTGHVRSDSYRRLPLQRTAQMSLCLVVWPGKVWLPVSAKVESTIRKVAGPSCIL
jgi:hypothetical protein